MKKNRIKIVDSNLTEDIITRYSGLVAISPFSIKGATPSFFAIHTNENSTQPVQIKIPAINPRRVDVSGFSFFLIPMNNKNKPVNPKIAAPKNLCSGINFSFKTISACPKGMNSNTIMKESVPVLNDFDVICMICY